MIDFEKIISGGDLRSVGNNQLVIAAVKSQNDRDKLVSLLFHHDRKVAMRAADALEKVTISKPEYLNKHKKIIFILSDIAENKELKWHLALLLPRLPLDENELKKAWNLLSSWMKDKINSKIVRVNSMQALFDLIKNDSSLKAEFMEIIQFLKEENIASINARIKSLMYTENNPHKFSPTINNP